MSLVFRLAELASAVGGRVRGDGERAIHGIAALEDAGPDDLSFLVNPRYRDAAAASRAGALLVAPGAGPEGGDLLEVDEPYAALARLLGMFHPRPRRSPGVSPQAHVAPGATLGRDVLVAPFAVVEDGARLGDRVVVGAGTVVGEGCAVGDDTELMPRAVLYAGTRVGRRCLIHAGVVLGGDGFGFATSGSTHHKVPQVGRVVVEDDVEIGANTTVDRAALGETRIGEGSKIDNLVMIAHGVRLGSGALMAAQSGIAGSTRVGRRTMWGGQSGAAGHLEIADGTIVAAKSAVFQDVGPGAFVAGIPAVEHKRWKRIQACLGRLPELRASLREVRQRLDALERRLEREED